METQSLFYCLYSLQLYIYFKYGSLKPLILSLTHIISSVPVYIVQIFAVVPVTICPKSYYKVFFKAFISYIPLVTPVFAILIIKSTLPVLFIFILKEYHLAWLLSQMMPSFFPASRLTNSLLNPSANLSCKLFGNDLLNPP